MYIVRMEQEFEEKDGTDSAVKDWLQEPGRYKVILFNDDYTTKDFVVAVLRSIFRKDGDEAVQIMETVHHSGLAPVGSYVYDIAATKVSQVTSFARRNGFPLKCTMEKE